MKPPTRTAHVATTLILVGVLAACGSSSSHATTTSSRPPTTSRPATSSQSATKSPILTIKDFAFHPQTVSVRTGQPVTIKNADSTTHTMTADDASFDTKNITAGSSVTFVAPQPGTYPFHCNFHGDMHGTLTVTK